MYRVRTTLLSSPMTMSFTQPLCILSLHALQMCEFFRTDLKDMCTLKELLEEHPDDVLTVLRDMSVVQIGTIEMKVCLKWVDQS